MDQAWGRQLKPTSRSKAIAHGRSIVFQAQAWGNLDQPLEQGGGRESTGRLTGGAGLELGRGS